MKQVKMGYAAAVLSVSLALVCAAGAAMVPFGYGNGNHGPTGYLGVGLRDVTEETVSVLHLREARGAEIVRVDHDGPAGKMGLREHDVVLQMNGTVIESEETVHRLLQETPPGRTVTLVISRDGQPLSVTAVLGDRGDVERQAWEQHMGQSGAQAPGGPQAPATGLPTGDTSYAAGAGASAPAPSSRYGKSFLGSFLMSPTYTGAMLEVMGPQLAEFFAVPGGAGLLVRSVAANSPAAMAGIRAGDVVVRANQMPVGSPSKWAKTVREAKGRPITVTILRDRQEKTLTLVPDSKHRGALESGPLGDPGIVMEPVVWLGAIVVAPVDEL